MVWFVVVAACVAPLLTALLSLGNFTLFGLIDPSDWLVRTLQFAAGDATGVAALAPFLLVLMRYAPFLWTDDLAVKPATWRWPAVGAVFKGLILVGLLALAAFFGLFCTGRPHAGPHLRHLYPGAVDSRALRFRLERGGCFSRQRVHAPFFRCRRWDRAEGFALQFGLLTLTFVSVLLSAVVTEWNRSEARLRHRRFSRPAHAVCPTGRCCSTAWNRRCRATGGTRTSSHCCLSTSTTSKTSTTRYGHAFGDAILKSVAATLQNSVRPGDTVARLGGDEFVMVLERVEGLNEAVAVSNRVRAALEQPQSVADPRDERDGQHRHRARHGR